MIGPLGGAGAVVSIGDARAGRGAGMIGALGGAGPTRAMVLKGSDPTHTAVLGAPPRLPGPAVPLGIHTLVIRGGLSLADPAALDVIVRIVGRRLLREVRRRQPTRQHSSGTQRVRC